MILTLTCRPFLIKMNIALCCGTEHRANPYPRIRFVLGFLVIVIIVVCICSSAHRSPWTHVERLGVTLPQTRNSFPQIRNFLLQIRNSLPQIRNSCDWRGIARDDLPTYDEATANMISKEGPPTYAQAMPTYPPLLKDETSEVSSAVENNHFYLLIHKF